MAIRTILQENDPILRKVSRPVQEVDDKTRELIDDMVETLKEAEGAGLAAVQVGVLRRIIVVDVGQGPMEIINPTIVRSNGEIVSAEGCLSIPGLRREVPRPAKVTVSGLNREGKAVMYTGQGLFARAICHEVDHLDGVLFVDKAMPEAKALLEGSRVCKGRWWFLPAEQPAQSCCFSSSFTGRRPKA